MCKSAKAIKESVPECKTPINEPPLSAGIQDNHYHPEGSDGCLLCDCYPLGSFSRACDRDSGQCQCKPGVIGRQCDRCDNPFAEVSANGCEGQNARDGVSRSSYICAINNLARSHLLPSLLPVIYDSCPQAIEAGIWWPRTKFGLPAAVSCPRGTLGTIRFSLPRQIFKLPYYNGSI